MAAGVEVDARPDAVAGLARSLAGWPPWGVLPDAVRSTDDVGASAVVASVPTVPPDRSDGAAAAAGHATRRVGGGTSTELGGVDSSVAAGDADGGGSVSGAAATTSGPPNPPFIREGSAKRINVPTPSSRTAAVPPATMLRVCDMTDSIGGLHEIRTNLRRAVSPRP